MPERFIPFRYNTYTDTLVAVGTARLIQRVLGVPTPEIELYEEPGGFRIRYSEPSGENIGTPFYEVRDKESRAVSAGLDGGSLWDKTAVADDEKPPWWSTVSVLNSLFSPASNNAIAQAYTPEVGQALLNGETALDKKVAGMKRSQLLYAPASKGAAGPTLGTGGYRMKGEDEQAVALLGYQHGAAGFIRDPYTLVFVPRPREIRLTGYTLLRDYLRAYTPRSVNNNPLPTTPQTLPFFVAMAYFDFIIKLFEYIETEDPLAGLRAPHVGKVVSGLDRVLYYNLGTSSAPSALDTLAIPDWLDDRGVVENVRDVLRQTLGEHLDPNLLYLPVRAFAESDPRLLVRFYRQYNPLQDRRRLLTQHTLTYVMERAQDGRFADLNADPMRRIARAIRSRTLTKLYRDGEQPDFQLLNDLRSASLADKRLVSMLSAFVSDYNMGNARMSAVGKKPQGPNLSYEDVQHVAGLIDKHGAEFVANTLLAQAMSKRPGEPNDE